MYTIGQVSEMFDLPISTLRYYDKQGLFPEMTRVSGIRKFDDTEIDALSVIECLKRSGLEIKDIKQFMDWCMEGASTYPQRKELFERQRRQVEAEMERMNQVLDMLKYLGMGNRPEDKVKVIFVPCYLDGKDGILNKHYYDLILGEDLSVYPSYYEPWGYTPLESVAFRVPTITTDLAGFGLWVNSLKNQHGINDGVEVLHRSDYNYSEVADGIKDTITLFSTKTDAEIKEIRKRAAQVAEQALWKHFIQYYYEAYDLALRNAMKRQLG